MQALGLRVPVSWVMARQPMPKALSPLQSDQRSYTSESLGVVFGEEGVVVGERVVGGSWYPRSCWSWRLSELVSKNGNLEFAGYQGYSGYDGCGIVIYSVSELASELED
jgi:hypothetical protein